MRAESLRIQTEQLTLLAIESDINRQTEVLQYEKAEKTAELAKLTALLS